MTTNSKPSGPVSATPSLFGYALLLTAVATLGAGGLFGFPVALLVLSGCLLLLVISLLWVSLESLELDEPLTLDEALILAQPSREEERKAAVLRALKDLEHERSLGKISEEDYLQLTARHRSEARALISSLDERQGATREQLSMELGGMHHELAEKSPEKGQESSKVSR